MWVCVFFGGKGGGLAGFRVWGLLDLKVWDFRVRGFGESGEAMRVSASGLISVEFGNLDTSRLGFRGAYETPSPPNPQSAAGVCCQ